MCSFIYGCALSKPILGEYFELPKRHSPNRNLIFDGNYRKITDVNIHFTLYDLINLCRFIKFLFKCSIGICISIYGYRKILRKGDTHFQRLG